MSDADLRAHAEGGAGVEPMLAAEVLELRAFVADLAEECERCKAGGRMVMVSYIEKRLPQTDERPRGE